jgi:integrase
MSKTNGSGTPQKPEVPYVGFPLFPHASGRWAKKIRGKIHFFGRWARTVKGVLTPVEDSKQSASEAKLELDRQWPYLSEGRAAPVVVTGGLTVEGLCNAFLTFKKSQKEKGFLSPRTWAGYKRAAVFVIKRFGKTRAVCSLTADDFSGMLKWISRGKGPTSVGNEIRHIRILFNFAKGHGLIEHEVDFGPSFKGPPKVVVRRAEQAHRREHGKRMLEAEQLRDLLRRLGESTKAADTALRAMILLGLNCGFGQTDVANLEDFHIEKNGEWVDYPRNKTAVERRIPLWSETVVALKAARKVRPKAKLPDDERCFFLTKFGRRWLTVTKEGCVTDTVGACFARLLVAAGMKRKGLNFYALRHITETIGGNCLDQVAVDCVMGHASEEMAAKYREEIFENRLRSVTRTIHEWLFRRT